MIHRIGLFLSLCALVLLVACGGSSRKGGSPKLSILSPEDATVVTQETITVLGSVNDATRSVSYSVNDGEATDIALESGINDFSFEASLIAGENTITVVAARGKRTTETSISVTYTADTTQAEPSVNILSPANGTTINEESVLVTGSVNDFTETVSYSVNDSEATTITLAEGSNDFSFEASLTAGENTIKVIASTSTETEVLSQEQTVTVTYQAGASGTAILTDSDLAAAPLIERIAQTTALQVYELDLTQRGVFFSAPTSATSQVSTQGIAVTDAGTATYVQEDPSLGEGGTRIISVDMETNDREVLYEGISNIQSVAVTSDGSFFIFAANFNDSYEIFAYDKTGVSLGTTGLHRLTDTSDYDESYVSVSNAGSVLAWQGKGSLDQDTIVYANIIDGKLGSETVNFIFNDTPIGVVAPSISGNGEYWTGTLAFFSLLGVLTGEVGVEPDVNNTIAYLPEETEFTTAIVTPTHGFNGQSVIFGETYKGEEYIAYLEGESILRLPLNGLQSVHSVANGKDFIYARNGNITLGNIDSVGGYTISIDDGLVDRSAYWARDTLVDDSATSYRGSNATGQTFVRPNDGGDLSDADRTVQYHARTFVAPTTSNYRIMSVQNYDGFLSLYENSFDPASPETNLVTENDDFDGGFEPGPPAMGTSAIFAELTEGTSYTIVTSAYGAPSVTEAPTGEFTNTIQGDVAPPAPPIQLPEPDNTRFNITVIFEPETDATLTDLQKSAFTNAAERWAQVITEDLEDVGPVNIPNNTFFGNTPSIIGTIDDLLILVRFTELEDGLLGQAGPRGVRPDGPNANLPTAGIMEFNINEFREGGFFGNQESYEQVIVHEMGHVIGIGTLWARTGNVDENYIASNPPTVPQGLPNPDYNPGFIGAGAVAQYSILTGQEETVVPISNTGGPGNYNGHWRELVFGNELMTPYAGGDELLSRLTAASLGDMGYTADINSATIDPYQLVREIGILEQVSPATQQSFTIFEDFAIFRGSASGDVTALVQAVDLTLDSDESTSGCEPEDFDSFVAGRIALVRRGTCTFVSKIDNARAAGAVAVIMFNQGNTEERKGFFIGGSNADDIPVLGLSYDVGVEFAGTENLELRVAVEREVGPLNLNDGRITTTAVSLIPHGFNEILLEPIGTMSSDGKIRKF